MELLKSPGSAVAYRRQKQIEDCLYENLLHRPYPSVSISDLCHQLGISRKAFYNYYPDKDSCFCSIIHRKLQDCMIHVTSSVPSGATLEETITVLLEFWTGQKSFFDIIVRNNLLSFLMSQTIHYVTNEDRAVLTLLNTPGQKTDTDILACYVSIHITLILQWHQRGFDTPVEEMVRKYLRLTHEPLIGS